MPGLWFHSGQGVYERQPIDVPLSHRCFSPSLSLPSPSSNFKDNKKDNSFPTHWFQLMVTGGQSLSQSLRAQGTPHPGQDTLPSQGTHTAYTPSAWDSADTPLLQAHLWDVEEAGVPGANPHGHGESVQLHTDSGPARNLFFFSHLCYKEKTLN